MSFDPNQSERFFVPPAVIHLLVAITLPTPSEKVLNINLDPDILTPEIKNKANKEPDYIRSNPIPEELEKIEQLYDIILCGPTFGISVGQLQTGKDEPGEEFWLKWGINHLSKSGRLAIIVPNGLLANFSQQNIRKFLLDKCDIQAIIELPPGWSQGTNVQASILLIIPSRNAEREMKMLRFSKFDTIPWDAVALSVLNRDENPSHKTFTSFTVKASQLSSGRLDAGYYDPKYAYTPIPDPKFFKAITLNDLVNIDGGERISKDKFCSYGIPYLQVANVGTDGNLYLRDVKFVDPDQIKPGVKAGTQRFHCIRGDLILTVAGTVGKIALVDDKFPGYGMYINTSSRRLRIKDSNTILSEYLFIHLRSEVIQQQIVRLTSGSVIPVLSSAELRKIMIYVPPLEKQLQLVLSLRNTTREQTQKIVSRFYGVEQEKETSHEHKSRLEPVAPPQPRIEEIVKGEFPFPIARTFRMLQRFEKEPYTYQVQELVAFSESIVYYLSAICIADQMTHLKIADEQLLKDIRGCTSDHTINKRLEVISAIQKLSRQDTSIHLFIPEITDADIGICKEIHERVRNSKAHTLPKFEFECQEIMKLFRPKLKRLLDPLLFLKDYKLVRVNPTKVRNRRYVYKFEYLTSDNDIFKFVDEEMESPLFEETGHVLLMNGKYEFLDLHPFYLFHGWESTGKTEHLCFFKYDASKKNSSKKRLKIESTLRAGEYEIESNELEELLNGFILS